MDVRVRLWRKLSAEELMLLNCGAGEDSWESLGLQGDPTSQSWRRSVLGVHWKDWCWSWNSRTLATWWEELTQWKDSDAGKNWRQEEKGTTEDKVAGWHHWLNGLESEQTPGFGLSVSKKSLGYIKDKSLGFFFNWGVNTCAKIKEPIDISSLWLQKWNATSTFLRTRTMFQLLLELDILKDNI